MRIKNEMIKSLRKIKGLLNHELQPVRYMKRFLLLIHQFKMDFAIRNTLYVFSGAFQDSIIVDDIDR